MLLLIGHFIGLLWVCLLFSVVVGIGFLSAAICRPIENIARNGVSHVLSETALCCCDCIATARFFRLDQAARR